MSVHIFATPQELAQATARHIASVINDAGRTVTLGLAGGSTPAAAYRQLATMDIDWTRVIFWLGDERWVSHDHEESNTRMVRETLTDLVDGRLLAPPTDAKNPATAAAIYSRSLAEVMRDGRPDLVLLGVGDDGHTASLFPGTEGLAGKTGIYLANWVEDKNVWRLTASLPLLQSARELVFLAQGSGKASVLSRIIDDDQPFPAQQVAVQADSVRWMLDEAAATQLTSIPR